MHLVILDQYSGLYVSKYCNMYQVLEGKYLFSKRKIIGKKLALNIADFVGQQATKIN